MSDKKGLAAKEWQQMNIAKALLQYDSEVYPSGETLPISTRTYRVNVVTTLLKAGIPLYKVDYLRDLLEENAYSLCDSTHLHSLVPFILQDQTSKLKGDIAGKPVAIIFFGTTHVRGIRYFLALMIAKSLTGEEVSRQLVTALSTATYNCST